eukprot:2505719-Amphidinium_carterae.1
MCAGDTAALLAHVWNEVTKKPITKNVEQVTIRATHGLLKNTRLRRRIHTRGTSTHGANAPCWDHGIEQIVIATHCAYSDSDRASKLKNKRHWLETDAISKHEHARTHNAQQHAT